MITDERFIWRNYKMLAKTKDTGQIYFLSPTVMAAIASFDPEFFSNEESYLIDNVAKPILGRQRSRAKLGPLLYRQGDYSISRQINAGVVKYPTVALHALQLALWLKPPSIILTGVDFINMDMPRFYETSKEYANSRLSKNLRSIQGGLASCGSFAVSQGISLQYASERTLLSEIAGFTAAS